MDELDRPDSELYGVGPYYGKVHEEQSICLEKIIAKMKAKDAKRILLSLAILLNDEAEAPGGFKVPARMAPIFHLLRDNGLAR